MNFKLTFIVISIWLVFAWQPVYAQEPDLQATLQKMQELLEQQQKELEAQRKELAEQRGLIQELQKAKQTASHEPAPPPAPQLEPESVTTAQVEKSATTASEPTQSGQEQALKALAEQEQAEASTIAEEPVTAQIQEDPSNTIYDRDFPGAWYLPGTTAAMKLGGYVNLSLVNSFDPMLQPDRFIVGSIPPKGENPQGAIKGSQVSAKQSRLNVEYREQTKVGEIRAFIEGDFQGIDQNGNDTFRLRHAFGQFRHILAGKTWSTLMDINSQPEEVDIEGINGQILRRNAQIRWFPQFGEKLRLKIALEDPNTDVLNGQSQKGNADLVASMDRMPLGSFGNWNYRVGVILRDLKASSGDGQPDGTDPETAIDSATGWGITTGGRQPVAWWGENDFLLWQLTYGKGIGYYINDLASVGGGDAVFDPEGKLYALPVFSGYVSYQHRWPMTWRFLKNRPGILRSSVTFSWVGIDTYDFQQGEDYKSTLRGSINLIYLPTKNFTFGMEYLWGQRKNVDGSKGKANQLQFAAKYTF
ncbi:MAG: porin [Gammaproteobacteria bacterium]|nr:porin [Gammaproteobacteria bacterium]